MRGVRGRGEGMVVMMGERGRGGIRGRGSGGEVRMAR